MTKYHMFRATNLRQSREFYTTAVGDVGDIKKVCGGGDDGVGGSIEVCIAWVCYQWCPTVSFLELRTDLFRLVHDNPDVHFPIFNMTAKECVFLCPTRASPTNNFSSFIKLFVDKICMCINNGLNPFLEIYFCFICFNIDPLFCVYLQWSEAMFLRLLYFPVSQQKN